MTIMLPFIVSVACVMLLYQSDLLAEAWLDCQRMQRCSCRAVAMYALREPRLESPMRGQDEVTELLVADTADTLMGSITMVPPR
jgi:hypothetical protein